MRTERRTVGQIAAEILVLNAVTTKAARKTRIRDRREYRDFGRVP